MSDYAFVTSCNWGYTFGLIATMNAQKYFGTDADWEVAYSDIKEDYRERISKVHKVTWTPIPELMKTVVDKRTDQRAALNAYWLSYWLLADKVLTEGKYKAVCVIQADQFAFVNLDVYFKMAECGILVCAEYAFSIKKAEELEFGDDRIIVNRSQFGVFDSINFLSPEYVGVPRDTVLWQTEDPYESESNFSVVTFNRAVCKYGRVGKVLGLDGRLWMCDSIWGDTKLYVDGSGDKVHNDRQNRIRGWHSRWWQEGRALSEWIARKEAIKEKYNDKEFMRQVNYLEHNFTLVRDFMARFNNMYPEIKSEFYCKGSLQHPHYELEAV